MEEFFYIILIVIWLLVSLYKRSAKNKAKTVARKSQPDVTTSMPKEVDLEEILEDFFGGGKKKKPAQADEEVLKEAEMVSNYEEVMSDQRSGREVVIEGAEPSYQSWESSAQREYSEHLEEQKAPEYTEPSYESFYKEAENTPDDYVAMEKVATVEDLIRSHAAKDAMEQARAEMEYGSTAGEEIPEFDLRTAVIFSEVLNRKFK